MQTKPSSSMVCCGTGSTFVLSNEGDLWGTGLNHHLQLGLPNRSSTSNAPCLSREYFELIPLQNVPAVREIGCSGSSTFAITVNNDLFSWGNNKHGQLGQGDADEMVLPGRVLFLNCNITSDVCRLPKIWQVACGNEHTLLLTMDNRVLSCGDNSYGQLGRADMSPSSPSNRFVVVYPIIGKNEEKTSVPVRSIESGAFACAMILQDFSLWMWGSHVNLQVPPMWGEDVLEFQKTPLLIENVIDDRDDANNYTNEKRPFLVESISMAAEHCACITTDKRVWTWGLNSHGKLGNGTKNGSSSRPTSIMSASQLQSMSRPVEICCGGHHTLIRSAIGSLWAAGAHKLGIGIDGGHETSLCRFQRVLLPPCAFVDGGGDMRVLGMAAGKTHSVIVTTGGHVMTCGKMKSAIPVTSGPPYRSEMTSSSGFGGLGYFQGVSQHGHVNTFHKVYQLKDRVSFSERFSTHTLSKILVLLLGVHLDKVPSSPVTVDRIAMNRVSIEVLDVIISQLLVSGQHKTVHCHKYTDRRQL